MRLPIADWRNPFSNRQSAVGNDTMPNDKNAFKAGLFILIAIGLGVAILFAIRGTGTLLSPMQTVRAEFNLDENLGGLKVGDPVRIGGFDQGKVSDIEFANRDTAPRFIISFTLPAGYDLREDAVVQIEQGLTGTANLNIVSVGAGKPYAEGTTLDGRPSALGEIYLAAAEAKEAVAKIKSKVDPAYDRYEAVMGKAEAVLASADKALGTGDAALANARDLLGDTKTDIRGTVANLHTATGTLKERLPTTFDKAEQFLETTTKTIDGAKGTLEDIRIAAANIKDATAEARSLLVRNRSKIDNMIGSLRNTSTNLESASAEIRRSPWRLLYQPKADELSNLNIYDSTREFAGAATNLNDAASAVRDAMADPSITTQQLQELIDALDASFKKYREVETKLWEAVK